VVIWYIFPVLVCCTGKNLATLVATEISTEQKQTGGKKLVRLQIGENNFFCLRNQFEKSSDNGEKIVQLSHARTRKFVSQSYDRELHTTPAL
jgi:hypothetical protein